MNRRADAMLRTAAPAARSTAAAILGTCLDWPKLCAGRGLARAPRQPHDADALLDETRIHPEMYPVAKRILRAAGGKAVTAELVSAHAREDRDFILEELTRDPLQDRRNHFSGPVFRSEVKTLRDISEGLRLQGRVTNVTDFGAFIDCGLSADGLLHRSKYAGAAPAAGQVLDVVVINVDIGRKRLSLGLPGREQQHSAKRARR